MDRENHKDLIECHAFGREFAGQKAVRRHYTLMHEKNTKISCQICYREYSSRSALERHHSSKHKEIIPSVVPDINPYFTMEAKLKAQNAYHDLKNTQKFRDIVNSTGILPSTSNAEDFVEPKNVSVE